MKFKGTLIVVKDCRKALEFYQDMFGFELIRDHDGNMELSGNLYLQEEKYWERFTGRRVIPQNNHICIQRTDMTCVLTAAKQVPGPLRM